MSISSLTYTNTSSATTAAQKQKEAQAAAAVDPTSAALKKADTKIQGKLDSTLASISGLGKFKAAVSDAQLAAKALVSLKADSSGEDVKKALAGFVSGFNAIVAEGKSVATDTTGAARIGRSMARAMSVDLSRFTELRELGFSSAADGTLKLDNAKLEAAYQADPAAVQASLAKLGGLADKVAGKELGTGGRIASTLDTLKNQSLALKDQQSALLKVSQTWSEQFASTPSLYSSLLSAYNTNAFL